MSQRSKRFEDVLPDERLANHGHLVVTRDEGQSMIIGEGADQVVVTAVQCTPGRVRFGIRAPRTTKLIRDNAVRTEPRRQPSAA